MRIRVMWSRSAVVRGHKWGSANSVFWRIWAAFVMVSGWFLISLTKDSASLFGPVMVSVSFWTSALNWIGISVGKNIPGGCFYVFYSDFPENVLLTWKGLPSGFMSQHSPEPPGDLKRNRTTKTRRASSVIRLLCTGVPGRDVDSISSWH